MQGHADERVTSTTAIVVPVRDGFRFVRLCLESVLAHTGPEHPVIVIDDCSRDRDLVKWLEDLSRTGQQIRFRRNPVNLGYSRSINCGFDMAHPLDVVILNSDTVVTSNWLDKLRSTAGSRPGVATVTPVSNSAGAFSVPLRGQRNSLPGGFTAESMAKLVESVSSRLRPEVPTGNGFCMYVSRRVLDEIGGFDTENFPVGYGEENDLCMRASAAGYVHLVDDSTFIFHRKSASFGLNRFIHQWLGRRALKQLHPSFETAVSKWLQSDPLDELRTKLKAVLSCGSDSE